jgi:hypothetical protein
MSERVSRLKHLTGWFAAGREVSRALPLLSDGAFKLYIHLCLTADRSSGRLQADHADLAKALGKSRRSVVVYLEELRRQGVCKTQPAKNQHGQGQIEICEAFWPYERPRGSGHAAKSGGLYRTDPSSADGPGVCEGLVQPGGREIGGGVLQAASAD